jgi:hypothetical protein
MIEPGEHFRFALETRQPFTIGRDGIGQHLYGNGALEARIDRAVDLTHAAHANLSGDFIAAKAPANIDSHGKPLRL